ncbi:gametocyte-specific factor 1 homolog [Melitaea cinxia]|uniref:gametocyte-specific factor 1 homolog n=1 Tax=Melitaea cinxia TaxID=113334 RepID=UPI001E2724A6|nr:gametocyte-specific factor 1 homolog [Melitaea cinxia]
MADPSPNQLVSCPFDKAHQVEHSRLHFHINKCKKQHRNSQKVTCPFDSTHIIGSIHLDHHVQTCPKRFILDSQKYIMDNNHRPVVEVQEARSIQSEENWDDEHTSTYVPDLEKKGPHIIRKVQGATPSERRKARMEGIANFKPLE